MGAIHSTQRPHAFKTCIERRKNIGGCVKSPQQPWLQPRWTHENTDAAIRCLSNRTVWLLGNSVVRHWAFILAAILDGVTHPTQMSGTSREMEKARCGRGGAWGGQRTNSSKPQACHGACACDFNVRRRLGPRAALLFKWNFQMDDSMLGASAGNRAQTLATELRPLQPSSDPFAICYVTGS